MQVQRLQLYRAALAHKDDLAEAHMALAIHFQDLHRQAEVSKDEAEAARLELMLSSHVAALPSETQLKHALQDYLAGLALLNLETEPSGANVTLEKFENCNRRLIAQPLREIGPTPLRNIELEMGSYVLRVRHPGFHDTIYPVFNRRAGTLSPVNPEGLTVPLTLLPLGHLAPDDCYVPAGWCFLGGDKHTPNSLPLMRVWVEGFVIKTFPVTHGEYVQFLNALAESGQMSDALVHVPREQSSAEGELGQMAYELSASNLFEIPNNPQSPHMSPGHPVTMIQWSSARAYADWYATQTGRPWRLPMEFEWEKAARGVDGRAYPWGDFHDPSWGCMKDSHQGAVSMQQVDSFPVDVSVYGVRGTAGNTRDWCLDKFRDDGPPLAGGRLLAPTECDLKDSGFKSTRGGSYGNSASRARSADRDWWFPERSYVGRGFRIAWSIDDLAE